MLAGWMNRKQQLVIEYLLEENKILREQLDIHANGKRLRYTAKQQRRLSDAGRKLGRQLLMQFANLVTPETIYAWHRKFVAMKYAPKNRDLSAAKERRAKRDALIIKIASENTGWGYGRIQGIMQHLGYHWRVRKTGIVIACQQLTTAYLVRLETAGHTLSDDAGGLDESEATACHRIPP